MEVAAGELYSGSFQVLSAQNLETSCAEDHESQALVGQVAVHSALQFTLASHRTPSHRTHHITSHQQTTGSARRMPGPGAPRWKRGFP